MELFKTPIRKYRELSPGAKATIWYTFSNIGQKGIALIVVPIYTRLLSTAEYGTYSVFLSWLEIFEIVATLRLFYGAFMVGLVKFEDDRKSYSTSLEALSVLLVTIAMALYLMFKDWVNGFTGMSTGLTLVLFAMLYAIPLLGFWKAIQRTENLYVKMVALTLAMAVATPLLGIAAVLFYRNAASSIIVARAIVEVGVSLVLFIVCGKCFHGKVKLSYWKHALKVNLPLLPYYLSTVVLNHSDRIVIQQLVNVAAAGIYSVAYAAATVMQLFSSALNSALQPWLFKKLKAGDIDDVKGTVSFSILIVVAVNAFLVMFAPEAMVILAPSQYHDAIWVIPPVTASVVVMYIYQQFVNVEFYYEESAMIASASVGAAILNLGLNILFVPIFGYFAAGYTTLASYVLFGIVHYLFMRRICRKHGLTTHLYDIRFTVVVLLAFFAFSAIALATYDLPSLRYGLLALGCVVIWVKRKPHVKVLRAYMSMLKQK